MKDDELYKIFLEQWQASVMYENTPYENFCAGYVRGFRAALELQLEDEGNDSESD